MARERVVITALCALLAVLAAVFALALMKRRKACATPQGCGIEVANIQGMGQRESQQDSFAVTDVRERGRGFLAVVADGMGGVAYGGEISRIVTSNIISAFQSAAAPYCPEALLLEMVTSAQDEARTFIGRNENLVGGSTVVAAIVKDGFLEFASAGDSRICLLRGGGLINLNREHVCGARGDISTGWTQASPQRGALTSYIGIDGQLQIDFNSAPIQLLPGDRVVLMSDGVFGTLSDREIAQAAGIAGVQQAGATLEQLVNAKADECQDNYTAIIIGILEEQIR